MRFWFLVGVILLVAFGLRLWNLGDASLWTDEVTTELRAHATLRGCIDSVLSSGNQTPFYFVMVHFLPNSSEFLLRLPSALLGVLGVGLMMFAAVQLYGNTNLALWAGALMAVNPYHVWLSRTARPYALIFVLSIAVSYFFLALVQGRTSRANWIGFLVLSMIAYVTHYFMLALPLAQYLMMGLTMKQNKHLLWRWFGVQVIAVLPLVAWLGLLFGHLNAVTVGGQWIPSPTWVDLPLTLWNMTVGYDGWQQWYLLPGLAVGLVGLALGMRYGLRQRELHADMLYWTLLLATPLLLVFVGSATVVSLYVDRYFMIFLPALMFLILIGWQSFPRQTWRVALGMLVSTGAGSVTLALHNGDYQRENWQAVANYLEHKQTPDDCFVTEDSSSLNAFNRYFPVGATRGEAIQVNPPEKDRLPCRSSSRVWAIYRNPIEDIHRQGVMPEFDPFDPVHSPLAEWLVVRRDAVVEQVEFNGVTILLLEGGSITPSMIQQGEPAGPG